MKKWIPIVLCLLFTVCASAAYTYDNADLFTASEEAEIAKAAEEILESSGVLCVILTDYGIGNINRSLPEYANGEEDMVLLAIDMSAREFDLYQYNSVSGDSAFRISTGESDAILDGILPEMKNGAYADAAMTFLRMTEEAFNNGVWFSPDDVGKDYDYVSYEEDVSVWDAVLGSMLVGAIAGGITVLCVRGAYKRKVHGDTYPLGQFVDFHLVENTDTFLTKSIIVTRIPDPPSGSGGGSGGHRTGGGGGARMGGRGF